jgi:small-conductance mechanosensitive channel
MDLLHLYNELYDKLIPYLLVIIVLVVAFFVINVIKRVIRKSLSATVLPLDIQYLLRKIIVYALWFAVLIYITELLNLDEILLPLLGASVLFGAAVALAVKDILADAVAGVFLLLDRHFNIADHIETMNYKGEIIDVTLRKTRIRTSDGTIVILPNGKIDSSGWVLHERSNKTQE